MRAVAETYIVQQGDHLSNIAEKFGFWDFLTIWDHPNNAELKKARHNAHILLPGDALYIPDKKPKAESRPTGSKHVFEILTRPLMLRIVLKDIDDHPIAGMPCELDLEGTKHQVQSDGSGLIEMPIPRGARQGLLTIPDLDMTLPVRIGHLDPADTESGWLARLRNLGYYHSESDTEDKLRLRYAIEEFQCEYGLKVSGELDAATRVKLQQVHGS